jgi:hypothetical protein
MPTVEQMKLITAGKLGELLETLDDDGTIEAYQENKRKRKNGFLIEQESKEHE